MISIIGFIIAYAIGYCIFLVIDSNMEKSMSKKLGNMKYLLVGVGVLFYPIVLIGMVGYVIYRTFKK